MIGTLLALQHGDTAFPGGGFAFSQGLEGLGPLEGKPDGARIRDFLTAVLKGRWAGTDRVALVRAHRAGGDLHAIAAVDEACEAAGVVEPQRLASRRQGAALLAAHARLGTRGAAAYRGAVLAGEASGHLPVVQGLVWGASGIDEASAVAMSGYSTAAGIASAAVRLGLVGAVEAQGAIAAMLPVITAIAGRPVADDEPLSAFAPHAEIAALRQAGAAIRLFSS